MAWILYESHSKYNLHLAEEQKNPPWIWRRWVLWIPSANEKSIRALITNAFYSCECRSLHLPFHRQQRIESVTPLRKHPQSLWRSTEAAVVDSQQPNQRAGIMRRKLQTKHTAAAGYWISQWLEIKVLLIVIQYDLNWLRALTRSVPDKAHLLGRLCIAR